MRLFRTLVSRRFLISSSFKLRGSHLLHKLYKRNVIIPERAEPSGFESQNLGFFQFLNRHKWSFVPGAMFLIAFWQDDQFLLRLFCILGSVGGVAYHVSYTHAARRGVIPAAFNVAYILLHVGFMYKIYLSTLPVRLEPHEQMCFDEQNFSSVMSRTDFKKFVDETSEFVSFKKLDVLDDPYMYLIVKGQVGVFYGNFCIARSDSGFLGEMGYLQSHMGVKLIKSYNEARDKGIIRLVVLEDTTCLRINKATLKELLDNSNTIKAGLLSIWATQHMKSLQTQSIERYVLVSGDYDLLLECLLDPRTVTSDDLKVLQKYRSYRGINDEAHRNSLQNIGWTEEDINDMIRINEEKLDRGEKLIEKV